MLYLLLHCARSLSVAQAAPAREGAQHRQHCGDGGWVAVPGAAPPPPHCLRCVLVSQRPPR